MCASKVRENTKVMRARTFPIRCGSLVLCAGMLVQLAGCVQTPAAAGSAPSGAVGASMPGAASPIAERSAEARSAGTPTAGAATAGAATAGAASVGGPTTGSPTAGTPTAGAATAGAATAGGRSANGPSAGERSAAGPAGVGRPSPLPGYLQPGALDILAILPPPPVQGDPRYDAERAVFKNSRKFEGTPRWELASRDAAISPADLLRTFSCAVGIELTPDRAPKILQVVQRATRDSGRAVSVGKEHFKKARPFQIDPGPTCQPPAQIGTSTDYPSGHSVAGWTWALVLARVVPERASAILARGRAYGDSRIVCGMHNPSAVEAGRLSGSAVMARVASEPEFRADVEAARKEFEALSKSGPGPDAARCDLESKVLATPIF